jgi:TonB family protein
VAISANIQGTVILEAMVDEDGNVESLEVLRSVPVLDKPALDAVKQWRYSPVILNGRPEKSILTVAVTFRLEERKG